jgi:hypothetical protein
MCVAYPRTHRVHENAYFHHECQATGGIHYTQTKHRWIADFCELCSGKHSNSCKSKCFHLNCFEEFLFGQNQC